MYGNIEKSPHNTNRFCCRLNLILDVFDIVLLKTIIIDGIVRRTTENHSEILLKKLYCWTLINTFYVYLPFMFTFQGISKFPQ